MMKQWRIGTLSMALVLISSGIFLLISGWSGKQLLSDLIRLWWPVIFVLLGLEIVVYLFVHKKNEPILRYDVFSILFVGILGMVCLGMLLLASVGILDEVRYAVSAQEHTVAMNPIVEKVDDKVAKIVVQADEHGFGEIHVSASNVDEVHLMGSYRELLVDDAALHEKYEKDAVSTHTIGDTMYIRLLQPPRKHGLRSTNPKVHWTIVLPEQLEVTLKTGHHLVNADTDIPDNWTISSNR